MNHGHGIQLPEWIFDIDDEDEISEDQSILQELEIDPSLIYRYFLSLSEHSIVLSI